jgi:hypothetical protein
VAADETGYLEEAGRVNSYFTMRENGFPDKGRWMCPRGLNPETESSLCLAVHSWRLGQGRRQLRSDSGKTVTLWNDGRQMFLAISDYNGQWAGYSSASEKKIRNGP